MIFSGCGGVFEDAPVGRGGGGGDGGLGGATPTVTVNLRGTCTNLSVRNYDGIGGHGGRGGDGGIGGLG